MSVYFPYVIIGGGISGITCAETLYQLDTTASICLISYTDTVKSITNLQRITKLIEEFSVIDNSFDDLSRQISTLTIIKGSVESINSSNSCVNLTDGRTIEYSKLCVCTGGKPKLIERDNPRVVGIRDTESVETFKKTLTGCKRIAIVGNGGIATELVFELTDCQIVWLIKDKHISSNFFDSAASKFLLNTIMKDRTDNVDGGADKINCQRHHYNIDGRFYTTERKVIDKEKSYFGGALGPDWALNMSMKGCSEKKVEVIYEVETTVIETEKEKILQFWKEKHGDDKICDYNVAVVLNDGSVQFCDLVVSATGVIPVYPPVTDAILSISETDGGILVGENMETNLPGIYAAGDCCCANWTLSEHWFQMRLWNQARSMGYQAAKSMFAAHNNHPAPLLDFAFELFTHVTKFFGFSVILLGLYNGQKLMLKNNEKAELLIRTSPGVEYIKCVVVDGRIRGAMLIGDTELAETLEDLILDQINVRQFGENLLDPNIDIVDYFD